MCIANGDGVVAGVMVVINEHFRKREREGWLQWFKRGATMTIWSGKWV